MSRFDESLKAVHALACLRHLDAEPQQIGIVFKPLRADCYPVGEKAPPSVPTPPGQELGEACHWEAQVRLGGGKWGLSVGLGAAPEEALESLLRGYADAHRVVDGRRHALMGRLGLNPVRESTAPASSVDNLQARQHRNEGQRELLAFIGGMLDPNGRMGLKAEDVLEALRVRLSSAAVPNSEAQQIREQGWRDVEKNLRGILDPSNAKNLTLDGLLNSVQALVDEKRERGGA